MKTFDSINHFVNHYKGKVTIPKYISITINGDVHSFYRTTIHNRNAIDMDQWDKYEFLEEESGLKLGIRLYANFFRYFDKKVLFEVYFQLPLYKQTKKLLCPIYFFDEFVTEEDYKLRKANISESLGKWTGLKWIDTRFDSKSFIDLRLESFDGLKKDLFYESMFDREPTDLAIFKNKWEINAKGESPYFKKIIGVPESWEEND